MPRGVFLNVSNPTRLLSQETLEIDLLPFEISWIGTFDQQQTPKAYELVHSPSNYPEKLDFQSILASNTENSLAL